MRDATEIADGVFLLTHPVLEVNVTLVCGDGAALLVDTLSTDAQAGELAAAVRRITTAPWTIVNTHHHFDHCYGNDALAGLGCAIWGHEEAARVLREHGEALRREAYETYAASLPDLADGITTVTIRPPDHTVHLESTLDIGGRPVVLRHLGRGHTAGDLIVQVPDADVTVAGDLIESAGPPSFADAYPLDWPDTVASLLLSLSADARVVPGHGPVVDRDFVASQHAGLATLAWRIRDGHADGASPETIADGAPFGPAAALVAVRRGLAELAGRV